MSTDQKTAVSHSEHMRGSELEKGSEGAEQLDRVDTVDVDNYHGIDLKTVLVYLVCLATTRLVLLF